MIPAAEAPALHLLTPDLCAFWARELPCLSLAWQRAILHLLTPRYGEQGAREIKQAACL